MEAVASKKIFSRYFSDSLKQVPSMCSWPSEFAEIWKFLLISWRLWLFLLRFHYCSSIQINL